MPEEGLFGQIKRFVVGEPIPSHLAHHERLSRVTGLAVLSSDPLSSVAYATEEILRVLILVNVTALTFAESHRVHHRRRFWPSWCFPTARRFMPIRTAAAPTSSPARTSVKCRACIAAAALLIDYILTVAVSIAAGVAALTSAFPGGLVTA